jgi:hypothetical protein
MLYISIFIFGVFNDDQIEKKRLFARKQHPHAHTENKKEGELQPVFHTPKSSGGLD